MDTISWLSRVMLQWRCLSCLTRAPSMQWHISLRCRYFRCSLFGFAVAWLKISFKKWAFTEIWTNLGVKPIHSPKTCAFFFAAGFYLLGLYTLSFSLKWDLNHLTIKITENKYSHLKNPDKLKSNDKNLKQFLLS